MEREPGEQFPSRSVGPVFVGEVDVVDAVGAPDVVVGFVVVLGFVVVVEFVVVVGFLVVVGFVLVGFVAHVVCENSADDKKVLKDVVREQSADVVDGAVCNPETKGTRMAYSKYRGDILLGGERLRP